MVLKKLQAALRATLRSLPSFDRAAGFAVALNQGKVQWTKSAMADALLAPNVPDFRSVGPCSCAKFPGPRLYGHLVTRDWQKLMPCKPLYQLCGDVCLAQRTMPSVKRVVSVVQGRCKRYLKLCGFRKDDSELASCRFSALLETEYAEWLQGMPGYLHQSRLLAQRHLVHSCGIILVRVDRNPGRLVAMCCAWRLGRRSINWFLLPLPGM